MQSNMYRNREIKAKPPLRQQGRMEESMDLPKIPDIALGKVIPDSVRIRQMEKEAENERYEKLESLLKQIQETTKEQIERVQAETESAKKDAKKANRIAAISVIAAILSLLVNVAMLTVSLMP